MARRHFLEVLQRGDALTSPEMTRAYLCTKLGGYAHEVFACLFLDNRHRIIELEEMFHATIDGASVYPREVARRALAQCRGGDLRPQSSLGGCRTQPGRQADNQQAAAGTGIAGYPGAGPFHHRRRDALFLCRTWSHLTVSGLSRTITPGSISFPPRDTWRCFFR